MLFIYKTCIKDIDRPTFFKTRLYLVKVEILLFQLWGSEIEHQDVEKVTCS